MEKKSASRAMLNLSDMQLAPQVLVTVTESASRRWMPEDPETSVSQSHVGLVSLIAKKKGGKRHSKNIKAEKKDQAYA